jgi:uncharacterized protein (DUF1697 family)
MRTHLALLRGINVGGGYVQKSLTSSSAQSKDACEPAVFKATTCSVDAVRLHPCTESSSW